MITFLIVIAAIAATFVHFVIVRLSGEWIALRLGLYDRYDRAGYRDLDAVFFLYVGLVLAWPVVLLGLLGWSFADWVVAPLTVRSDRSDGVGHE